jgi:cytochrome P450
MATVGRESDIESVELTDPELWLDGPPHEAFKQMRGGCPIHWTDSFELFPEEPGFWSVTTAEDVHTVSRDWQTYSSERGGVLVAAAGFPLELAQAMFIGMDPPKHDRLKALFQAGDLLQRHAGLDGRSRADAAADRRSVADSKRGRGVAADVPRLRALPPHRHLRYRVARAKDQGGREGGDVVRLVQP